MSEVRTARMDKTQFSVASLADEDGQADVRYWQTRTPHERLQAVELLRQIHYHYDPAAKIQRVLIILPLPHR